MCLQTVDNFPLLFLLDKFELYLFESNHFNEFSKIEQEKIVKKMFP